MGGVGWLGRTSKEGSKKKLKGRRGASLQRSAFVLADNVSIETNKKGPIVVEDGQWDDHATVACEDWAPRLS
jgi:hypothetical protein